MLLGVSVPPVLVAGQAGRNASNHNALSGWSGPGIAGKPIVPAPAVMRAHRTGWTSRRGKAQRRVCQRKDLDVLPAPVGHPAATKCSPGYIDPVEWSEQDWLTFHRQRSRW